MRDVQLVKENKDFLDFIDTEQYTFDIIMDIGHAQYTYHLIVNIGSRAKFDEDSINECIYKPFNSVSDNMLYTPIYDNKFISILNDLFHIIFNNLMNFYNRELKSVSLIGGDTYE
jgi:hypothetical protein